ncbi:MAG: adenylate kinase [Acidimicrobiales bacterium]
MERLILVVLGKQGAGKGTQCERLSALYGLPHVSTGDILRAAVRARSPLGLEVAAVLEAGALVSDELVNRLVADRLAQPDAAPGVLLDGYPRTRGQAEALEEIVAPDAVSACLDLAIDVEVATARLAARRVCTSCGAIYRVGDPEAHSGVCSVCGGAVVQRADDRPEAIAERLAAYERDTAPLLDYYRERGVLAHVDGSAGLDEVTAALRAAIDARVAR